MRVLYAKRFIQQYSRLSPGIQLKIDKQIEFLLNNLRHPSLRTKKYNKSQNIWQARVDDNYRFYFRVKDDVSEILSVIPHPK